MAAHALRDHQRPPDLPLGRARQARHPDPARARQQRELQAGDPRAHRRRRGPAGRVGRRGRPAAVHRRAPPRPDPEHHPRADERDRTAVVRATRRPPPPACAATARPTPPRSWRSSRACCSGARSRRRSSRPRSAGCSARAASRRRRRPRRHPVRVVSLVPSVTETLLAWGVTPGGGHPVLRAARVPDGRVARRTPTSPPSSRSAPDLVVVNDEENRREDADALRRRRAAAPRDAACTRWPTSAPASPPSPPPSGADRQPEHCYRWSGTKCSGCAEGRGRARRRAFVPIWRRPWMTLNADTYGSSVLAALGVDNVFADDPDRYPTTTLDDAAARRPDLVLAPSEPYPFQARHVAELRGGGRRRAPRRRPGPVLVGRAHPGGAGAARSGHRRVAGEPAVASRTSRRAPTTASRSRGPYTWGKRGSPSPAAEPSGWAGASQRTSLVSRSVSSAEGHEAVGTGVEAVGDGEHRARRRPCSARSPSLASDGGS